MSSDNAVDGAMYIRLASYLRRLRAIERCKPKEQRLSVPTLTTLSEVAGVSSTSMSRMANGHTRSLNLDVTAAIMREMWKRGFNTDIKDILSIEIPSDVKPDQNRANDPWGPLPSPPPPLTRRQHRKYPGEEFVRAYEENSDNEAFDALVRPIQPEMLPEIAEVMRMLTEFPEPIQKNTVSVLKGQLEVIQEALSRPAAQVK
ncbi:MAG: helix-turn-helix domain-containing protein [Ardenticatenaceae bacterium]